MNFLTSEDYLKALEHFIGLFSTKTKLDNDTIKEATQLYNTIKKGLLELKSIKEAKVDEAVECLEKLINGLRVDCDYYDNGYEDAQRFDFVAFNGEALHFETERDEEDFIDFIKENKFNYIKQALQRLKVIDNPNSKESLNDLEMLSDCAEAMKEAPSSNWIEYAQTEAELDLKLYLAYSNIQQVLLRAQADEKLKVDICELFGLDNLYPYNNTNAILKELEEYMDRKNQLWVDYMKASKQLKEKDRILNIINEKCVNMKLVFESEDVVEYNKSLPENLKECCKLTEDEFKLVKRQRINN